MLIATAGLVWSSRRVLAAVAVAVGATVATMALLVSPSHVRQVNFARAAFEVTAPYINYGGVVNAVAGSQPPLDRKQPVALYGGLFGAARDTVHVWVAGREATILYRDPGANKCNFARNPSFSRACNCRSQRLQGVAGSGRTALIDMLVFISLTR